MRRCPAPPRASQTCLVSVRCFHLLNARPPGDATNRYFRETGALELETLGGFTALDLAAARGVAAWDAVDIMIRAGAAASPQALEVHAAAAAATVDE